MWKLEHKIYWMFGPQQEVHDSITGKEKSSTLTRKSLFWHFIGDLDNLPIV